MRSVKNNGSDRPGFKPAPANIRRFALLFSDSMIQRLLIQAEIESGWHTSRTDENPHLTIKNASGVVVAHYYHDGSYKMVPTRPGGTRMPGEQSLAKQRELCLQISKVLRRLIDELARTERIYVESYAQLQRDGLLAEYLKDWTSMTEEFRSSILTTITAHLQDQHVPYIRKQCKHIADAIKEHQGYRPADRRDASLQ